MLTALALAAHNAPEGLAVGMASMQEAEAKERGEIIGDKESRHTFTFLVVFAIALHNIPEGIAVAVALYNSSHKKMRSFLCVFKMMNFALKVMSFAFKMMDLSFKMMKFVFKMTG